MRIFTHIAPLGLAAALLAGCGTGDDQRDAALARAEAADTAQGGSRLRDLFAPPPGEGQIAVNRFIWTAALDTLSFLPLESADPFSGVIVTGWGRLEGAPAPYRATVYVSSAALDARSLRVALFRQSGGRAVPVSEEVAAEVEDAILTRARQLQVAALGN